MQTTGDTSSITNISNPHRWWIVALLFTASMINYFDRATISIALPLISKDLSLGPATKGLLLSAFFWSYALMQIPIGLCADRFNLRWLYAGAFALWSIAQGLSGFAGGLTTLMILRVCLGIGESIYLPGGTRIVSLLFEPKDRGFPCGLFDMGTRTGLVLDGILVPWMIMHYGWRRMFFVVGFSALLWLIPWLLIFPARLNGKDKQGRPGRHAPDPVLSLPASVPGSIKMRPVLVRRESGHCLGLFCFGRCWYLPVTLNRNLVGICLGFFCFDYYWYLLVTWLPDYLVTVRHLTILKAGLYASLPYFVFGVSEPIGGWIADRIIRAGGDETRTRKGIVTVAFCTGLLLIPAARAADAGTAILLVIAGSLVGLATGNLLVILQCCAPPGEVGRWTGVENFVGNIAGILAPIVTGVLIARTGSYFPGFALAAFVLVAGILSYWLIVGKLQPMGEAAE